MNTITAFCLSLGLAAIGWVGAGFAGTNPVALAMCALIGAAYLLGAYETLRFRAATSTLVRALDSLTEPPAQLEAWLERVDASLRASVRLRIERGQGALPSLALTPYLVGLLVMLGMLGTFLGMVATFRGTVFALQGSADLEALRNALSAPVKGLGLAFGTSVAGVASSAMLGLMSALARRERMIAAGLLDARAATVLRAFSLGWQQQQAWLALQEQGRALPAVAERLDHLLQQIAASSREQRDAIESLVGSTGARLAQAIERFDAQVEAHSARAEGASAQVAGSAIELASLGEAFSHGVQHFGRAQDKLIESLQRVEGALNQGIARSDEQLAYYVAQAREVIDLSISAQQGVIEDLRRLRARPAVMAAVEEMA